jgi:hypothetical protein
LPRDRKEEVTCKVDIIDYSVGCDCRECWGSGVKGGGHERKLRRRKEGREEEKRKKWERKESGAIEA